MRLPLPFKVISLFGRRKGHFPVPAKFHAAAARSGGPGRRKAPARMRLALDGREPGGRLVRGGTAAWTWCAACGIAALLLLNVGDLNAQPLAPIAPSRTAARLDLGARIDAAVAEAARRFDLPEAWIRAVMRAESALDPHAVSRAGAMGLMQLMPRTWATFRARLGLGGDPFDVRDNIIAGAAYLRDLLDRFGAPGFLAAYNAGPGRYADHLATARPLPPETRAYVAIVGSDIGLSGDPRTSPPVRLASIDWTRAPLFAGGRGRSNEDQAAFDTHRSGHQRAASPALEGTHDPLFAVRIGQRVQP